MVEIDVSVPYSLKYLRLEVMLSSRSSSSVKKLHCFAFEDTCGFATTGPELEQTLADALT